MTTQDNDDIFSKQIGKYIKRLIPIWDQTQKLHLKCNILQFLWDGIAFYFDFKG